MTTSLHMPNPSQDSPPIQDVTYERSVVIVGANGSGKSRLGLCLEQTHQQSGPKTHVLRRISANRMINVADEANRVSLERANERVAWGANIGGPRSTRGEGDPITSMLNDFQFVIDALFAARDAQALAFMKAAADPKRARVPPMATIVEQAQTAWQAVFPERKLHIDDYSLKVRTADGGQDYGASQLSDGERVGLYLIGHALCTPRDAILLIDEPEIHLHESIQASLWDAIEQLRPDCRFIYITHDLGFATSRSNAPRIVLRDYQAHPAPYWKWEMAPADSGLPEDVLLRIAGSRRRAVFVEGGSGSIDRELFSAVYPDRYVVPADNCEAVIRSVQSFNKHKALHHTAVAGIIDPDDRDSDELSSLKAQAVFAIGTAHAENILAAESVFKAVGTQLQFNQPDLDRRFVDARHGIHDLLKRERDTLVHHRALYAVQRRIGEITPSAKTAAALVEAVNAAAGRTDPAATYAAAEALIDAAIASADYKTHLLVLRNKGVLAEVAKALNTAVTDYRRVALALIRADAKLRATLAAELPELP
jgi:ABC-type cobalamin/Fe3+-siderophores transport system ATPase subunit